MNDFFLESKSVDSRKTEKIYSVTEFNTEINALLNQFSATVQGEVSGFKVIQDKFVRFDIKDKASVLGCFMGQWQMNFQIQDGMEIKVRGKAGLYVPQGRYTFRVDWIEPVGEGALRKAYELTFAKLEKEGLMDPKHKKALPVFPETIGLVTSTDAAAYTDVLKILGARWSISHVFVYNARVQGSQSVEEIVKGVEHFNKYELVDVMIITRGGGSLEDLQSFNSELVCRAIFASKIPTICGVGHERDTSLAELVADARASTPTNAAQLAVPDKAAIQDQLRNFKMQLSGGIENSIQLRRSTIMDMTGKLLATILSHINYFQETRHKLFTAMRNFNQKMTDYFREVDLMKDSVRARWEYMYQKVDDKLKEQSKLLNSLNPMAVLNRGYSVTYGSDGKLIKSVKETTEAMKIVTQVADGKIHSKVTKQMILKI